MDDRSYTIEEENELLERITSNHKCIDKILSIISCPCYNSVFIYCETCYHPITILLKKSYHCEHSSKVTQMFNL